jgi:hypothetical protein
MRPSIAAIISMANNMKKVEERVAVLQQNETFALKHILRGMFDPGIVWDVDSENVEYNSLPKHNADPAMLYGEAKRLYIFTKDGNQGLRPERKKMLFIQLLESLSEDDAKLVLSMVQKKSPFKNITADLVQKAFPGLF